MLRWCDGFEHYGSLAHATEGVGGGAAWSSIDGQWALSSSNPATGAYHLRYSDGGATGAKVIRRIFGQSRQVVGLGYRFAVEELPETEGNAWSAFILAGFRDVANDEQCMIVLGTDGSILAIRGGQASASTIGGTLLGRSLPCVAAGGYHHFEIKAKIANSDGFIEVRVNQNTVLNLTGVDTQTTANAEASQVVVGRSGSGLTGSPGVITFDLDDAFAWDDDSSDPDNTIVDFIGDKGCYWLKPNSDTATSQFTVNASATAFGAIDEVPPSGTDYLDTDATSARTIVGVQSLPGNVAEVIAIMPLMYARKEESGAVTMRTGVVSGSSESYGPDDNPSTGYAYLRPAPKTVDPATGVAWANTATPKLLIERTA
jgi:hypothetical protein